MGGRSTENGFRFLCTLAATIAAARAQAQFFQCGDPGSGMFTNLPIGNRITYTYEHAGQSNTNANDCQ